MSVYSFFNYFNRCLFHGLSCAGTGLLMLLLSLSSTLADDGAKSLDLRLFGTNVIEEYDGCRLAFWQSDKNPQTDKYAYVFFAPFNDGEELPAWMKIGKTVFELQRQDETRARGQQLEGLRLYRTSKGTYTVLTEILSQHVEGNDILVDKARIIITRNEHYPFVASVKGGLICPQTSHSASDASGDLYGEPAHFGAAVTFDRISVVPGGVMETIGKEAPDCSPGETSGFGASYAISDTMTLWEVPCNLFARTGSSVFVTALNENPSQSSILTFPGLPDHGDSEGLYEIRSPRMDPETGIVVSEYYDGDGSCGTYEAYQLRVVEGEALEFFLLEYREKPTCDGVQGDASGYPLLYSAR